MENRFQQVVTELDGAHDPAYPPSSAAYTVESDPAESRRHTFVM